MPNFSQVDVVGVGLNATDTNIPVPYFPRSGSKTVIPSANVLLGGQVATAMAACQTWGLRTRYVGKLGDDHAAALHRAEFSRLGIEAQLATATGCTSPQSFILVEPTGERTVLLKRDPRLTLLPEELKPEWI
jgi:sulfofructose kinase